MKKLILITIALLVLCIDATGQGSALILVKTKNGVERSYYDGKIVKAVLLNGAAFKGTLTVLNDSCIKLGPDTIRLSQVERFRIKSTANFISGGLIIGAGMLGTAIGINMIAESAAAGGYAAFFGGLFGLSLASVGVMAAGTGLVVILAGKKYTRYKWQYSTRIISNPAP